MLVDANWRLTELLLLYERRSDSLPKHERGRIQTDTDTSLCLGSYPLWEWSIYFSLVNLKGQLRTHVCEMLWLSLWEIIRSWERLCAAFRGCVCGFTNKPACTQAVHQLGQTAKFKNHWSWYYQGWYQGFYFYFCNIGKKNLERQRALDHRQGFLCCCQPRCLPIVSTSQHTRTNTHRQHGEVIVWNKTHFLCLFNLLWRSESTNTHTLKLCHWLVDCAAGPPTRMGFNKLEINPTLYSCSSRMHPWCNYSLKTVFGD